MKLSRGSMTTDGIHIYRVDVEPPVLVAVVLPHLDDLEMREVARYMVREREDVDELERLRAEVKLLREIAGPPLTPDGEVDIESLNGPGFMQ